jgi:hypothetical protein
MLTLVFAVLAVSSHEGHDEEHDDAHGEAIEGDLAAAAAQ